jgi:hypothetical protein
MPSTYFLYLVFKVSTQAQSIASDFVISGRIATMGKTTWTLPLVSLQAHVAPATTDHFRQGRDQGSAKDANRWKA